MMSRLFFFLGMYELVTLCVLISLEIHDGFTFLD
jgi:hypothetical protein